jgi:hypothetical protein
MASQSRQEDLHWSTRLLKNDVSRRLDELKKLQKATIRRKMRTAQLKSKHL